MTLDDLRALADEFFEWPDDGDRRTVSTISALLFAQHVLEMHEKSLEMHEKSLGTENNAGMDALRDAAQQALEALDRDHLEIQLDHLEIQLRAAIALRAALEQQAEPEPVAWMCPDDPERETAFHWQAGHCANCGKQRIPLYTAPPQRKPLTDEEEE